MAPKCVIELVIENCERPTTITITMTTTIPLNSGSQFLSDEEALAERYGVFSQWHQNEDATGTRRFIEMPVASRDVP